MPGNSGIEAVGFGAGALDIYLPIGQVGNDHEPGAKVGWTEDDQAMLADILAADPERHIGGNAVNALAYLACRGEAGYTVHFVTVLGTDEYESPAIASHLQRVGIRNRALVDPDYHPSVSLIERAALGSDRMVRGRPRTPMDDFLTPAHIANNVSNADLVVVSSLKSPHLAGRIFQEAPDDAAVSYNPGSSEFRDHPKALIKAMLERNPMLLALNDEEIRQLFREASDADIIRLAEQATELSENVLCTLGAKGIVLAQRGANGRVHTTIHEVTPLPGEMVVDTLGAGDRAHAVAIDGLLLQKSGRLILQDVAASTAEVIQRTGAHGDLYARA